MESFDVKELLIDICWILCKLRGRIHQANKRSLGHKTTTLERPLESKNILQKFFPSFFYCIVI